MLITHRLSLGFTSLVLRLLSATKLDADAGWLDKRGSCNADRPLTVPMSQTSSLVLRVLPALCSRTGCWHLLA
jgi:hypothetical protein